MDDQKTKSRFSFPSVTELRKALSSFSVRGVLIIGSLILLSCLSILLALRDANRLFLTEVPSYGGEIREGIIGSPRFVNPVLAISESDTDLVNLIYSGLMRRDKRGVVTTDLADNYTISDDGLVYTFTLSDSALFHDGTSVTSDDVVYTILMAQDPIVKSPRRINWEGIRVESIDKKTIRFTLKQPYPPFIEENAPLGILPKHIWKDLTPEEFSLSDYNINPIGSGPYKVESVQKTRGIPSEYDLVSFGDFTLGRPYIDNISLVIYPNEKALISGFDKGDITNISAITPEKASGLQDSSIVRIEHSPLPRLFALFFNQSEAREFLSKNVREALNKAIDKKKVVGSVLFGFGTPLDGPVPPSSPFYTEGLSGSANSEDSLSLLEKDGWKKDPATGLLTKEERKGKKVVATSTLSFSITTSDIPELRGAAKILQDAWKEIGVETEVKIFSESDLRQNAIKPRKYDTLLYGNEVEHDAELFAYWHSSERMSPGLNYAMYTNTKVDKALEDMRISSDEEKRANAYKTLELEIENDTPAIFLYSPDFIYVVKNSIKGISLKGLQSPADRFSNVYEWYINKEYVWPPLKNIKWIKAFEEWMH